MPGRMAGRAALITGGGGGIGAATGRLFAEESAVVALVDTGRAAVDAAAAAIRSEVPGSTVLPLVADLSQESEARRAVDEAVRGLGALHTLVNVAGVRVFPRLRRLVVHHRHDPHGRRRPIDPVGTGSPSSVGAVRRVAQIPKRSTTRAANKRRSVRCRLTMASTMRASSAW